MEYFSTVETDWGARRLNLDNVATAKSTILQQMKAPDHLIMLSRKSLSADADGNFDLDRAIKNGDLRPVSGAHTCAGGVEIITYIVNHPTCEHKDLLPKLKDCSFKVIFVDDEEVFSVERNNLTYCIIVSLNCSFFFFSS